MALVAGIDGGEALERDPAQQRVLDENWTLRVRLASGALLAELDACGSWTVERLRQELQQRLPADASLGELIAGICILGAGAAGEAQTLQESGLEGGEELLAVLGDGTLRSRGEFALREAKAAACSGHTQRAYAKSCCALTQLLRAARELGRDEKCYLVDNSQIASAASGLAYRSRKDLAAMDVQRPAAAWGSTVRGHDLGDGWLRDGDAFLPMAIQGHQVLACQSQDLCELREVVKDAFREAETLLLDYNAGLPPPAPQLRAFCDRLAREGRWQQSCHARLGSLLVALRSTRSNSEGDSLSCITRQRGVEAALHELHEALDAYECDLSQNWPQERPLPFYFEDNFR